NPFFVSLDGTAEPNGVDVEGIRIGLNGGEARVGQSFGKIDTAISSQLYTAETGQPLATLGAVVPLEKGPDFDEFFLTFDRLGANTFNRPPLATPSPPVPQDLPAVSEVGVRTFDEIHASLAVLTGVNALDDDVQDTLALVRQSMPSVDRLDAVLASHQVSIAQLAIEYCNALVDDENLRDSMFQGFAFTSPVSTAWPGVGSASENAFIDPLLDRILGPEMNPIGTQPSRAAVRAELDRLVHGIPGDSSRPGLAHTPGAPTGAARTQTIAKAVCSAVVGSAAMLVQ